MLRGGVSDKLGNGYEALWALRQALRVLRGHEARHLKIEPIAIGKGFEFVVDAVAGPEWHQSKRRGVRGNWTIPALQREGFFSDVVRKALEDERARFTFVSIDPASDLATLVDKARLVENFADFERALSATQAQKFTSAAGHFGLAGSDSWALLRRLYVEVRSEHGLKDDVQTEFGLFVHGDPEAGVRALKEILDEGLTQTLSTERLRGELLATGFRLRDASLDPTLPQRLDDQNHTYQRSYGPLGADGRAIARREPEAIIAALADPSVKFVVVTGVAGAGKSGVLRQAAEQLREAGAVCMLARIDRLLHVPSAEALGGQVFGREESPCRTLAMLAGEQMAVLFIDQLDAVSEISGRQSAAKDLIFALLKGADLLPNLKLVLSCRAYDFDTDRRFKAMAQSERCKRVTIEPLNFDEEVAPYLRSLDIDPGDISPDQRILLRLPINLMLYVQLRQLDVAGLSQARTTSELFVLLLKERDRELRERGVTWTAEAALGAVAVWMSDRERFDAPEVALVQFAGASPFLISANLLARDGPHLRFFHESLFDYILARTFLSSGASVTDWLVGREQILFRRTQVRQALELLRVDDPKSYRTELERLLTDAAVRAHIKDMAARWLAALPDPANADLDIVLKLDTAGDPPLLLRRALGGAGWVALLIEAGILQAWLREGSAERRSFALWLLDSASKDAPTLAADCLRAWWKQAPERYEDVLQWMRMPHTARADAPLAALYAELIAAFPASRVPEDRMPGEADIGYWVHQGSDSAAALYGAWLARWFEAHALGHPFGPDHMDRNDGYWLSELAKTRPLAYAAAVAPPLAEAFRHETAEGKSVKRYTSAFNLRMPDEDGRPDAVDLLRAALKTVAKSDADAARTLLAHFDTATHPAAMHLVLETIAVSADLADMLEPLIDDPLFLEAGFEGASWKSAADALATAWPRLCEASLARLDRRLEAYRPELIFARELLRSSHYGESIEKRRKHALRMMQSSGEDLWGVLAIIGAEQLQPKWRAKLGELERKFQNQAPPKPYRSRGGIVRSPIGLDRAAAMDDAHWLKAIAHYQTPGERNFWDENGPIGGADQLAHVLQERCKADPARFVKLAAHFPSGTYSRYYSAIIEGVGQSEAPPAEIVTAAAHLAIDLSWSEDRHPLPQLIERKPLGASDAKVWQALVELARHGADAEKLEIDSDGIEDDAAIEEALDTPNKVWFKGAVSERGRAIEAIGAGAWETPALVEPTAALVAELSALALPREIRCCLVNPAHAVAAIDVDRGLALLDLISANDAWPLGTRRGVRLVTWALFHRTALGWKLLDRVLKCEDAGLRRAGLWILGQFAHENDDAAGAFEKMWEANPLARRIAARIAIGHAQPSDAPLAPRTTAWLRKFFADPDEAVQREAANYGRCLSGPDRTTRGALAEELAQSPAFQTDPDDLLHGLEGRGAEHPRVVIASAKAYFVAERDGAFKDRMRTSASPHWLAKTILSAYRHLESDPAYRGDALDIIDQLVEHDQFGSRTALDEYERH